jgi:hypothetical protein
MATASGSSGLHGVRTKRRLRSELPLIPCGECENRIVVEYRMKEGPNKGHIFYTCPDSNVSCFFLSCLFICFADILRYDFD